MVFTWAVTCLYIRLQCRLSQTGQNVGRYMDPPRCSVPYGTGFFRRTFFLPTLNAYRHQSHSNFLLSCPTPHLTFFNWFNNMAVMLYMREKTNPLFPKSFKYNSARSLSSITCMILIVNILFSICF